MPTTYPVESGPTTEQLSAAFQAFYNTLCAVTAQRSEDASIGWIQERAQQLSDQFHGNIADVDFAETIADFSGKSEIALLIIIEEMHFFADRYDPTTIAATPVDERSQIVENVPQPSADRVVEDAETVVGSIEKLFKKLPIWMQRLLDVGLELLKLSSGRI